MYNLVMAYMHTVYMLELKGMCTEENSTDVNIFTDNPSRYPLKFILLGPDLREPHPINDKSSLPRTIPNDILSTINHH